jgi:hypothetical protein
MSKFLIFTFFMLFVSVTFHNTAMADSGGWNSNQYSCNNGNCYKFRP